MTVADQMTPELWQRLKPLYDAGLEKPEQDREQFLAEVCAGDAELREELNALLKATDARTTLDHPPILASRSVSPPETQLLVEGALILDRFRIVRHLGSGGMGDVYEAFDVELGRIALKTVRADIVHSPELLLRFKREVQLARRVSGPHVCRIHELFVDPSGSNKPPLALLTMSPGWDNPRS